MDGAVIDGGNGLVMRGVVALLFGIAAVFWPGITLVTLVYLFATFILISGVIDLISGIGHVTSSERSVLTRFLALIFGLLELGVGVYLLRHPTVTFATLILLIGFTFIIGGVFRVMEGLFEEGPSGGRILQIILGLITVLAGIIVLFQPAASGVAFVWIVGLYALITGPMLIVLGHEVNKGLKPKAKR